MPDDELEAYLASLPCFEGTMSFLGIAPDGVPEVKLTTERVPCSMEGMTTTPQPAPSQAGRSLAQAISTAARKNEPTGPLTTPVADLLDPATREKLEQIR